MPLSPGVQSRLFSMGLPCPTLQLLCTLQAVTSPFLDQPLARKSVILLLLR